MTEEPFAVTVEPTAAQVVPGEVVDVVVTIANTQAIVDSATIEPLGELATWARADPAVVQLLPGTVGTTTVRIAPPAGTSLPAGSLPFAVLARSSVDPERTTVGEGVVGVAGTVKVDAELAPVSSTGRRSAKHRVELSNHGNTPVRVSVVAHDPDELLELETSPSSVTVPAGGVATVRLSLRAGSRDPSNPRIPFTVAVTPADQPEIVLQGAFRQKGGAPRWLVPALLAVVALGAILIALRPKGTESVLGIGANGTTTTVAGSATTTGASLPPGVTTVPPGPGNGNGNGEGGSGGSTTTKLGVIPPTTNTSVKSSGASTTTTSLAIATPSTSTTKAAPESTIYDNSSPSPSATTAVALGDAYAQAGLGCFDLTSVAIMLRGIASADANKIDLVVVSTRGTSVLPTNRDASPSPSEAPSSRSPRARRSPGSATASASACGPRARPSRSSPTPTPAAAATSSARAAARAPTSP